jgi:hypothetical protein
MIPPKKEDPSFRAFRRRLLEDPSKIESVCKVCGEVIVGGVLGLRERELKHFHECEGKAQGSS